MDQRFRIYGPVNVRRRELLIRRRRRCRRRCPSLTCKYVSRCRHVMKWPRSRIDEIFSDDIVAIHESTFYENPVWLKQQIVFLPRTRKKDIVTFFEDIRNRNSINLLTILTLSCHPFAYRIVTTNDHPTTRVGTYLHSSLHFTNHYSFFFKFKWTKSIFRNHKNEKK